LSGSANTIGGAASGAGNLISGNRTAGILITGGSNNNQVLGNKIGTNAAGTAAVGNIDGIRVTGNGNTIGGTASGAGNLISGNRLHGVDIFGISNLMLGNSIGTTAGGNGPLGNDYFGIELDGNNNTVGGTGSGAGNVISGNSHGGVLIDNGASGNQVLGNYIGTDPGAVWSVGNSGNGIEVAGNNNTIGGTAAGARNFLSGNSKDGVRIDSGASGNQVVGNYVGLLADGTSASPNSIGIEVAGSSNTVGGAGSGAGNLISGNNTDGMLISGSADQVLGNTIGVAAKGFQPLANGTGIVLSGSGNTIGGTAAGTRNIISGNHNDGVLISGGNANQVVGNYIGTTADGSAPMGNGLNGIAVNGSGNFIGGGPGAGNLISGNGGDGVKIDSGASGNHVSANIIGDNPASDIGMFNHLGIEVAGSNNTVGGTFLGFPAGNLIDANEHGMLISGSANQVFGNSVLSNGTGIEVDGSGNTIGGTFAGARNLISGNGSDGLHINGSGNQVLGNYIGTNAAGNAALPNSGVGIAIAGSSNVIGGSASGAGNLISGNSGDGLKLAGNGNLVWGNAIGTRADGTGALGNSGNGIEIGGNNNTVGGTASAARNLISGNSNDGVLISGSGNQVLGNYLGTDVTGTKPLANRIGVELGGNSNTIGGTASGASNLISGDPYAGLVISGSGNQVLGNAIGVALGGNAALADGTGIVLSGSANTIGGAASGAGNLISGNSTDGILIAGGNNNQVLGNNIGTNAAGTAAVANHHSGIFVESGSGNTIGTAVGAGNLVSGNSGDGVRIASSSNLVLGNTIGTNAAGTGSLGNGGNGIELAGNDNTVGGSASGARNLISGNSNDGVLISAGQGNTVRQNSIFANGPAKTGPGITLQSGANNDVGPPFISSAILSGTTLTVKGIIVVFSGNVSYLLDFYANPSGDPEGKIYLGSLTVTGTPNFTFTTTTSVTGANPLITATLTDDKGNTSAFSTGVTVGSSLASSPPPINLPPSSPPSSSPPPSSGPPSSNSPPTLSQLRRTREIANDTAAMPLQSNTTALLKFEGYSEMFLGQSLPSSSDLFWAILSDLNVSGSAGLFGSRPGINFADGLNGKAS
jgi:hypothetical protein